MKALTIRQPWASLIAAGVKTIETRSWSTRYRGPLAIHAGAHRPTEGEELCGDSGWYWDWDVDHGIVILGREPWNEHPAPLGAVVATCTLADVVPIMDGRSRPILLEERTLVVREERPPWSSASTSTAWVELGARGEKVTDQIPLGDFTTGRYAWLLADVQRLEVPVPAKGRQGLWDWETT